MAIGTLAWIDQIGWVGQDQIEQPVNVLEQIAVAGRQVVGSGQRCG
jgi:hypothetical protein